jgi:hypothetical protein
MVIVEAVDIMYHVMIVIMLDQMYVIAAHLATMLRQNGMSVIVLCRAIMVGGELVLLALPVQPVLME